jgi:hypothetical protein
VPSVYHFPLSVPVKGDISTLQNWGHFYFALTPISREFSIIPSRGDVEIVVNYNVGLAIHNKIRATQLGNISRAVSAADVHPNSFLSQPLCMLLP